MCGIAGLLTKDTGSLWSSVGAERNVGKNDQGLITDVIAAIATRMALAIEHRGPDGAGVWSDPESGVAVAHRRLSIVELSQAGHQPMRSPAGRYVVAFNGEIYNHKELRAELQSVAHEALGSKTHVWRGHSDTETLLACFDVWGIEATLTKVVGMFAISLWDTYKRELHLVRDRFGEKPLYYGWTDAGTFVFGSELKALRAHPGFSNPISREALALYVRFCYVPAPHSIYQNIYKLEPGCILTLSSPEGIPLSPPVAPSRLSAGHSLAGGGVKLRRWWSLTDAVEFGAMNQAVNEFEALQVLENRLKSAIGLQSQADVPMGAFLSGGIDSSAIVALLQEQLTRPVKTFTVGFEEASFDESPHARAIAEHLGTDHSELFVSASQTQAVISQLPQMYDEPFADSSQIPTHLVCKAARRQVTVALSGDAGDELFGGYNRYFWGPRIWSHIAWLPYSARQAFCKVMSRASGNSLNQFGDHLQIARPAEKLQKLVRSIRFAHNIDDLYMNLVSAWQDPASVVKGVLPGVQNPVFDTMPTNGLERDQLRMMFRDSTTYLPDDILCKVDRAAMAVSLETRVPFLDHRVAEFAWQLPLNMKVRGNVGKWALRQILYKYVPRELIDRPKIGFGIPIGNWLRGPLRDWAESLLSKQRLEQDGYFYVRPIREKWAEHLSGKRDHTASLWAILMFQAWLAEVS
jgi:asparagine synthase (glutamine-hydrolysing)